MVFDQVSHIGYVKIVGVRMKCSWIGRILSNLILGEGWGERGYILIERGRNICGITSYVAQIGTKPNVNNAVRLMNFHIVYFAIFCLFVNLK